MQNKIVEKASFSDVKIGSQKEFVKFKNGVRNVYALKNTEVIKETIPGQNPVYWVVAEVVGLDGKLVDLQLKSSAKTLIKGLEPLVVGKTGIIFASIKKIGTDAKGTFDVEAAQPTVLQ